jgi:hypothetical protein
MIRSVPWGDTEIIMVELDRESVCLWVGEIQTVLTWCSFAALTGTSVKEIVVCMLVFSLPSIHAEPSTSHSLTILSRIKFLFPCIQSPLRDFLFWLGLYEIQLSLPSIREWLQSIDIVLLPCIGEWLQQIYAYDYVCCELPFPLSPL